MRRAVLSVLALAVLGALSQGCSSTSSSTSCFAGCLCFRTDKAACEANGCPWSGDGGYCYNGPTPGDGGAE